MKFRGKIATNPLKIQTGPLGPYDPIAPFCATIYSNNAWKGSLSLVEMRTQPSFSPSLLHYVYCTAIYNTTEIGGFQSMFLKSLCYL